MKWFHKLLNPHCPECRVERNESKYCVGCDTLQVENDRLRDENRRLLDRLLIPHMTNEVIKTEEFVPIPSRHVPLSVQREKYEREDRRLADKLRAEAPKPDKIINKEKELELLKELEVENA